MAARRMNRRDLLLGGAVLLSNGGARAQEATRAGQRPFHLLSRPASRWRLQYLQEHGPFEGIAYFPVPPDDPGQRIVEVEVYAETSSGRVPFGRTVELGPLKKPVFRLALNETSGFRVFVAVEAQFYETALQPGKPRTPPTPLSEVESREYLSDGWPSDEGRRWFHGWMGTNRLIRTGTDADVDFAYSVLEFMQNSFRYKIPDEEPEWKEAVKRDPAMGDWHYTLSTRTGECWRLSDLYCRILRMNAIPARLISGNHVGQASGHHLRSLIYLESAGWTPVEATAAVSSQRKPPVQFMGNWGGTMLNGNQNIGFLLGGPNGKGYVGTFDSLAFCPKAGDWEIPQIKYTAQCLRG